MRTSYSPSKSTRCSASMVLTSMRRMLCAFGSYIDLHRLRQRVRAHGARRNALRRGEYFSISTGEMLSTSAMLSKPSPESSVGKSCVARKSTASRSRIVLLYSLRFRRRAVTRPGSGLTFAIGFLKLACQIFQQAVDLGLRRPRHAFRRHLARADFLRRFSPTLPVVPPSSQPK